jgi:hypothetical protein
MQQSFVANASMSWQTRSPTPQSYEKTETAVSACRFLVAIENQSFAKKASN